MLLGGTVEQVLRKPQTQFCININKSETKGRKEIREREKEEKERVWEEKETERRQMNMCNPCALRIPFTVTDSGFDYEIETRHQ